MTEFRPLSMSARVRFRGDHYTHRFSAKPKEITSKKQLLIICEKIIFIGNVALFQYKKATEIKAYIEKSFLAFKKNTI